MRRWGRVDRTCSDAAFAVLAVTLFAAPWFFGAWEMWWFWPFVVGLALAGLLTGVRMLLPARRDIAGSGSALESSGDEAIAAASGDSRSALSAPRSALAAAASALPFLAYAWIRALQAPVRMDAERSFLLFFTSYLIGLVVLFGLGERQRRFLGFLLLADLILIGIYGVVNHALTGSRVVMWEDGYVEYWRDDRASGPFYCPNHLAGAMDVALAMGLGWFFTRRAGWMRRGIAAAAVAVALAGVYVSRSRAGGAVALAVAVAAAIWGPEGRPTDRWLRRAAWLALILVGLGVVLVAGRGYMRRFDGMLTPEGPSKGRAPLAVILRHLRAGSRGQMIEGTIRGWKMAPVWGVGPGMHQHVWPHVAASPDGDRERGIWPSHLNNYFHSYEAHSDWLQLLEEYGIVGMALLLIPTVTLFEILRRNARGSAGIAAPGPPAWRRAMRLGGFLALVAMGLYSWADFNLQIPAVTWLTAAAVALGLAAVDRPAPAEDGRR